MGIENIVLCGIFFSLIIVLVFGLRSFGLFSRRHLESRIRLVSAHPLREAVQDLGGDGEAEGRNEVQRGGRHLQRGQSQARALFNLSPKLFHSWSFLGRKVHIKFDSVQTRSMKTHQTKQMTLRTSSPVAVHEVG